MKPQDSLTSAIHDLANQIRISNLIALKQLANTNNWVFSTNEHEHVNHELTEYLTQQGSEQ